MPLSALLSQDLCAGPGSGPASLPLHPVSSCWRFQNSLPGLVGGWPVLPARIALDLLDYVQDATKQEESCNKGSGARYPCSSRCLCQDQLSPPRMNYRVTVEGTPGESAENTDSGSHVCSETWLCWAGLCSETICRSPHFPRLRHTDRCQHDPPTLENCRTPELYTDTIELHHTQKLII